MTIDEAIKQQMNFAEINEYNSKLCKDSYSKECLRKYSEDYRQLAEWLTELKEAKKLLKSARNIIEDVICNEDYLCNECEYRAKCDGGFSFYWRYADEALKLIGEDGESNGKDGE